MISGGKIEPSSGYLMVILAGWARDEEADGARAAPEVGLRECPQMRKTEMAPVADASKTLADERSLMAPPEDGYER